MENKPLRDDLMGRDDHEYTEEEETALGDDDYNENDYGGSSVSTNSSLLGSPTRAPVQLGNRDDPTHNAQKRIMERQRRARIEEMEQERRRHRAHMFVPPGKRTGNGIDTTPALFTCRNCGCRDTHMKKCGGGCKGHYLCSEMCLHDDWNAGGHKKVCLRGGGGKEAIV